MVVYKHCLITSLFVGSTEEHRLRVFNNKLLRKLLGPKRKEVTGGWRKLYNEELHNFCSSPHIIRVIKSGKMLWAGSGRDNKFIQIYTTFW
jgi:hypothetical protein